MIAKIFNLTGLTLMAAAILLTITEAVRMCLKLTESVHATQTTRR